MNVVDYLDQLKNDEKSLSTKIFANKMASRLAGIAGIYLAGSAIVVGSCGAFALSPVGIGVGLIITGAGMYVNYKNSEYNLNIHNFNEQLHVNIINQFLGKSNYNFDIISLNEKIFDVSPEMYVKNGIEAKMKEKYRDNFRDHWDVVEKEKEKDAFGEVKERMIA